MIRWRPHRPSPAAAWLLVLALLQAQALGLWHRVAHPSLGPATAAQVPGATGAATADPFGHAADDDRQCRIYDALGLADGVATALPVVPAAAAEPRAPRCPATAAPALAAARPYLARAPPA